MKVNFGVWNMNTFENPSFTSAAEWYPPFWFCNLYVFSKAVTPGHVMWQRRYSSLLICKHWKQQRHYEWVHFVSMYRYECMHFERVWVCLTGRSPAICVFVWLDVWRLRRRRYRHRLKSQWNDTWLTSLAHFPWRNVHLSNNKCKKGTNFLFSGSLMSKSHYSWKVVGLKWLLGHVPAAVHNDSSQ